ncbi:MAG: hypothetical protein IJ738_05020, partial [Alphaproteobacteria bacterium]|nr:hypothetical protein [Alphaproteobacteria bacterium]
FPQIVNILMNAAPDNIDIEQVKNSLLAIKNIKNVHHLHLWCISEHNVAIECHIESDNNDIIVEATKLLRDKFGITHCNFQVENKSCGECCDL